jgi:hypothetical protein
MEAIGLSASMEGWLVSCVTCEGSMQEDSPVEKGYEVMVVFVEIRSGNG